MNNVCVDVTLTAFTAPTPVATAIAPTSSFYAQITCHLCLCMRVVVRMCVRVCNTGVKWQLRLYQPRFK